MCAAGVEVEWRNRIWAGSEVITYYVGTDGTEGEGAAHVEMSAVQSQEDFNIIKAIRLNRGGKKTDAQ